MDNRLMTADEFLQTNNTTAPSLAENIVKPAKLPPLAENIAKLSKLKQTKSTFSSNVGSKYKSCQKITNC